jgi:hypothetical protein
MRRFSSWCRFLDVPFLAPVLLALPLKCISLSALLFLLRTLTSLALIRLVLIRPASQAVANREIARKRAVLLEAELASGDYVERPRAVGIEQAVKQYLEAERGDGCRPKTMAKPPSG